MRILNLKIIKELYKLNFYNLAVLYYIHSMLNAIKSLFLTIRTIKTCSTALFCSYYNIATFDTFFSFSRVYS